MFTVERIGISVYSRMDGWISVYSRADRDKCLQ